MQNLRCAQSAFSGPCTGPPPVLIASAAITPAAGFITNVIPNAGPVAGGTTVKLVGSHLGGATAVDFGSQPATSFHVLSASLIEAVAPATNLEGNTQGVSNITVTTAAGPSKVQPLDRYTYVDTTLGAIVDSVTPSIGTSAGGTPVVITGAGFAGGPGQPNCDQTDAITSLSFGSVVQPDFTVQSDSVITTTAPPGSGLVNVSIVGCDESTPSPVGPQSQYNYNPGYVLAGSDGGIFSYGKVPGHAGFFGSAGNLVLNRPVVGVARTPNGNGYWLAASDGGVFNYGGAGFFGSAGNLTLNSPVVGIASTWDGGGYWLVASDGGVFAYGDAQFHGSAGGTHLSAPVVGIAGTPSSNGYWLVAADGGVFAYGGAQFHGSLVGQSLATPVSAIGSTGTGNGYWLVTQGGAVFSEGDAGFFGDQAGFALKGPIVGIAPIVPNEIIAA